MATPTKATKRAPAKRAPKATAPTPPPPADDSVEDAPLTITWQGRTMPVKQPSAGMVGVWKMTMKALEGATWNKNLSGDEAADAASRAIQVVLSVLVGPADRDWVTSLLLEDTVSLEEAAGILTLTNDAYQAAGTRTERRAAAKTSKARLR